MNKEEMKAFAKEIADEAIIQTQEAFSVMMNDKMDQMHRDAMIMVEQIRDDNMIFGEAISGLSDKFDRMSNRLDTMDNRFDRMSNRLDTMDNRFDGIDSRLDSIDNRLDAIDSRLDSIDGRLDGIDGRLYHLEGDVEQIKTYIFDNVEPRMYKIEMDTCGTVYAK